MPRLSPAVCGIGPLALSLLTACGLFRQRTPPKPEAVDFTAQSEVISPGDSLIRVRVIASNGGTLTWTLEFGPCSMNIRVTALAPAAPHAWEFERWRMTVNPRAGCVGFTVKYPLPPGGSVTANELERIVRVRDVLGDSLAPGRYRVTTLVSFSNQAPIEVPAGEIDLRRND